jgi:hypothetical protein
VIGASSLTDDEFDGLEIEAYGYDQETYDALAAVLIARESVSTTLDRLEYYFLARGVELTAADSAQSNIYLGSALE